MFGTEPVFISGSRAVHSAIEEANDVDLDEAKWMGHPEHLRLWRYLSGNYDAGMTHDEVLLPRIDGTYYADGQKLVWGTNGQVARSKAKAVL